MPSGLKNASLQKTYNPTNGDEAAARTDGDHINSKVWWDVK